MDPWASQPSGTSSRPASSDARPARDENIYGALTGYSFEVADPKGMVKLTDPDFPQAIGYSALSCVITVDFGSLSASSELDFQSDALRSFFEENARAISACYASSPRDGSANPVKVTLAVSPSGQITSASANDSKLAACVADVTKKSTFPKLRGNGTVTVTYEVRFTDPGPNDCPT